MYDPTDTTQARLALRALEPTILLDPAVQRLRHYYAVLRVESHGDYIKRLRDFIIPSLSKE